ncbi:MAG: CBU_0592 family membrane protein [Flammeovirgaceae bacterium]
MGMYEFIGWVGAIAFIVAYFLLVAGKLSAEKPFYHALNVLGGLCLVINAVHLIDKPTIVVNLVWTAIALVAIIKIVRKK